MQLCLKLSNELTKGMCTPPLGSRRRVLLQDAGEQFDKLWFVHITFTFGQAASGVPLKGAFVTLDCGDQGVGCGVAPLVALARDGTGEQKTAAAGALRNLAANADNQLAISQAGGIKPLLALARDGTDEQRALAAGTLDAYEGRLLNKDGTPAWPLQEEEGASASKEDL